MQDLYNFLFENISTKTDIAWTKKNVSYINLHYTYTLLHTSIKYILVLLIIYSKAK